MYNNNTFSIIKSLFLNNNINEIKENYENINTIPILIISYNNHKYVANTVRQIIDINSSLENSITIIDNNSDDNPLSILQPYIDQNIVTLYILPMPAKQLEYYKYVYDNENLKENTKWLIITDLDEFWYTPKDNIKTNLSNYMKYDIIYSNWRMFGSDGLIEQPKDIRISITHREEKIHSHTKYIIQTKNINSNDINIHTVKSNTTINLSNIFRLNHYPIMSLEYFKKVKMTRGDVAVVNWNNIRDMNYFNKYDKDATFEDIDLKNLLSEYIT